MTMRWALVLALLAILLGGYWMVRGAGNANEAQIAAYAGQCPRWVKLAEELLTFDGAVPERCEHVAGGSLIAANQIYKAAPNIEVLVTAAADPALLVPSSVVIRDTKSKASVTYNAEALALLK